MIAMATRRRILSSLSGRRTITRVDVDGTLTIWPRRAWRRAADATRAALKSGTALLGKWRARQAERVFLEHLHDHELKEMGLSREGRRREVNKPFWRE
jgi:uncharacterized protein YjiS (DUF1127 family)